MFFKKAENIFKCFLFSFHVCVISYTLAFDSFLSFCTHYHSFPYLHTFVFLHKCFAFPPFCISNIRFSSFSSIFCLFILVLPLYWVFLFLCSKTSAFLYFSVSLFIYFCVSAFPLFCVLTLLIFCDTTSQYLGVSLLLRFPFFFFSVFFSFSLFCSFLFIFCALTFVFCTFLHFSFLVFTNLSFHEIMRFYEHMQFPFLFLLFCRSSVFARFEFFVSTLFSFVLFALLVVHVSVFLPYCVLMFLRFFGLRFACLRFYIFALCNFLLLHFYISVFLFSVFLCFCNFCTLVFAFSDFSVFTFKIFGFMVCFFFCLFCGFFGFSYSLRI